MAFVLSILLAVVLSPWLVPLVLRRLGTLIGWYIRHKTLFRRQTLFENSSADSEEQGYKKDSSSDDGEWEKVEGYATASAPNGGRLNKDWKGVVGVFHPFCNAGGGGERVLWAAIRATQLRWPDAVCVVYTADHDADKAQIIKRVQVGMAPRLAMEAHCSGSL